jgi:probable DNA repair protein
MDNCLSRHLAEGAVLVADDRLAAIQLEVFLARAATRGVWPSVAIRSIDAWLTELWLRQPEPPRLPLRTAQAAALWRRIIAESAFSRTLVDERQVARWATDAWKLMLDWRIDLRQLHARGDHAFDSFLGAARRYAAVLTENGWLDPAELPAAIAALPRAHGLPKDAVIWADHRGNTPAMDFLASVFAEGGAAPSRWRPAVAAACVHRTGLEDADSELDTAFAWATGWLERDPRARIAVIAPRAAGRDRLVRRYAAENSAVCLLEGAPLGEEPVIGAALTCLELVAPAADFHAFSRWLRSPFLGAGLEPLPQRCGVEAELRNELIAQLRLHDAYRAAGLDRWIERRAPSLKRVLDELMMWLERLPARQTPTAWSRDWHALLARIGWPGEACEIPPRALDAWNRALTEFAALSPVTGAMTLGAATAEIRRITARMRHGRPLPRAGISVITDPQQLGPGYDAVWMAGLTDAAWPRASLPNPLLPLALQKAHGMPDSSPQSTLQRCRDLLHRLATRAPTLILSYARTDGDVETGPSPLIAEFPELDSSLPAPPRRWRSITSGPGGLEILEDRAPPLAEPEVAGGAATLRLQARCPLRAFIERRLDARPLDAPQRGLGGLHRGLIVHRAFDLFYSRYRDQRALAREAPAAVEEAAGASVEQALSDCLGGARRALRVYAELERQRLEQLILRLVHLDLQRADYAVECLEAVTVAEVAGRRIRCRIDRVDRLSTGDLAVIDYKSGSRASPADWFKERLLEPQLPLYVRTLSEPVAAMVLAAIQAKGASYRGVWVREKEFPGSSAAAWDSAGWQKQQAAWAAQLELLVEEYARGDTRIFLADLAAAQGGVAPLTRVYEQQVLTEGWLEGQATS